MESTYVIVGGGIAGVSCLEHIYAFEPDAQVTLISASPLIKVVTSVTPLTKMLSEYSVEEKPYDYMSSVYPSLRTVIDKVSSINSTNQTVTTASGTIIKYRKLCLCNGASPKVISGENEYVIGIRDTDSATDLQNRLKTAKRVVVVGNGGIASEVVHDIVGVDIIWAVKDKHISAAFVDPGAAEFFHDRLHKNEKHEKSTIVKTLKYEADKSKTEHMGAALGPHWNIGLTLGGEEKTSNVAVEYEVEVKSVTKSTDGDWPVYVELTNGKVYGCDFVISATGVVPNSNNVALFGDSFHVSDDGGIKVNSRMETNVRDIYAAGDVCSAAWQPAKHWLQMRLWTQARQMGAYAAKCMMDSINNEETVQDFCFELFTHVTRFFGYKVILLGLFNGQTLGTDYEMMLRVTKGEEYIKLVISKGRIQGAILIGETDLEEMCENLILNQLDVSDLGEDLLNPNIDIEDYFD